MAANGGTIYARGATPGGPVHAIWQNFERRVWCVRRRRRRHAARPLTASTLRRRRSLLNLSVPYPRQQPHKTKRGEMPGGQPADALLYDQNVLDWAFVGERVGDHDFVSRGFTKNMRVLSRTKSYRSFGTTQSLQVRPPPPARPPARRRRRRRSPPVSRPPRSEHARRHGSARRALHSSVRAAIDGARSQHVGHLVVACQGHADGGTRAQGPSVALFGGERRLPVPGGEGAGGGLARVERRREGEAPRPEGDRAPLAHEAVADGPRPFCLLNLVAGLRRSQDCDAAVRPVAPRGRRVGR